MGNRIILTLGNHLATVVLGGAPPVPLGPFVQGQLLPIWRITVRLIDNSVQDLSTGTYAGTFFDPRTQGRKTAGGSFTSSSPTTGVFTYAPVAADVNEPGSWIFEIAVTISAKALYGHIPLEIVPRFAA